MTIVDLQEYISTKKGERDLLKKSVFEKILQRNEAKNDYDNNVKARWLLSEAQIRTQVRFKGHVEGLVTKAIQAVYPRDFQFLLDFERVRNKLECVPRLKEGNTVYDDIRDCQGGGLVDVIAFGFRLVLWHLMNPKSINTIILDEPFRFLGEYTVKAGQMLKEVSHKLGVQIIMVTHDDTLAEIADRSFTVIYNGVKSIVHQKGLPIVSPLVRTKVKK
jgi:hypothetical protein